MIRLAPNSPEIADWRRETLETLRRHREVTGRHLGTESQAATRSAAVVESADLAGNDRVWRDGDSWVWVRLHAEGSESGVGAAGCKANLFVATGPFDAEELLDELRDEGVTTLSGTRVAGDQVLDPLFSRGKLTATRMEVKVADVPNPTGVRLAEMADDQLNAFMAREEEHYAHELFETGSYPDLAAARAESQRQHEDLFPGGKPKDAARLWSAYPLDDDRSAPVAGQPIGMLWIELGAERAFIYNIEVDEDARGHGYGTQILRAGAEYVRSVGLPLLGLNVFGHNDGARRLYLREGYRITEEHFTLAVSTEPTE